MITDEHLAIERLIQMIKEKTVVSIDGKTIPIEADSVCVHGDGPKALQFVNEIRQAFQQEGIAISPLADVVD